MFTLSLFTFLFCMHGLKNALTRNTLNVNVLRTFGRQYVMSAVIWLTSGIWVFHWCRLADTDWRPKTDQKTTGHHASTNNFYLLNSVNKLYMSLKSSIISTVLLQLRKKKSSAFSLLDDSGKSADRRLIVYWLY